MRCEIDKGHDACNPYYDLPQQNKMLLVLNTNLDTSTFPVFESAVLKIYKS